LAWILLFCTKRHAMPNADDYTDKSLFLPAWLILHFYS
jgi:hypothetical protein